MKTLLCIVLSLLSVGCFGGKPQVKLQNYGQIHAFSLTNQSNETVTANQLKGKIWVANFIFTSCGAECPFLTRQLHLVQKLTADESDVGFVSLSVDPQTDTPARLNGYATNYGVDSSNWHFLTGEPDQLNDVIRRSFLLPVAESSEEKDELNNTNFIHSNKFVVVDQTGMARFHVDGMLEEAPSQVLAAIRQIRAEG